MIQASPTPAVSAPPAEKRGVVSKPVKPSHWLWVPTVWLFFASTRTLSSWLAAKADGGGELDVTGSPADRILMSLLILLGLYLLAARGERTKRILAKNKVVVALFLYMALSLIWSNFPDITLRRCIRSTGTVVMVLMVLTERAPLEAIRILLQRIYVVHIPLSIIVIKYFRNIGVLYNWSGEEEQWIGMSIDKNSLGQVAMCAGVFFLWQILRDWPRRGAKGGWNRILMNSGLLAMTLWLLRGSKTIHSSAAILGFLVCSAILLSLQYIRKRAARAKRIILGSVAAICLLAPIVYLVFAAFDTTPVQATFAATGRDMTLTDRTLLWTDILNNAAKSPIVGVGMGAFFVGPIGYDLYPMPNWSRKTPGWRPEEGHNGFVDVFVELGAIGLIMMIVIIVLAFPGALSDLQNEFQLGSLRLVLFIAVLMNNIAETSFLKGTHDLWFLFLLFAISLPRPKMRLALRKDGPEVDHPNGNGLPVGPNNGLRDVRPSLVNHLLSPNRSLTCGATA